MLKFYNNTTEDIKNMIAEEIIEKIRNENKKINQIRFCRENNVSDTNMIIRIRRCKRVAETGCDDNIYLPSQFKSKK